MILGIVASNIGTELDPNDVFPQTNAASITDVDATTDWYDENNSPTETSDSDSYHGDNAIKIVSTNSLNSIIAIDIPTQSGKVYDVSIWAKRGAQGTDQVFRNWQNVGSFSDVTIDTTSYAEYTWSDLTPDTPGTDMTIWVYVNRSAGAVGDEVFIDKVQVIEKDE